MEIVCAAIEDDLGDAGLGGALGECLAHFGGGSLIGAVGDLEIFLQRGGRRKGHPVRIVDDLRRDVLFRTEDRQPRTAISPGLDCPTNTRLAAIDTRKLCHFISSCLPCGR